jgi:hypothetical protein
MVMEKSNFFGLWAEHCGASYPSLLEQPINVLPELEAVHLAHYLKSCPVWIASPGVVYSPFRDGGVSGTGSILTDGVWAWSDTMAYYVSRFRITAPLGFLRHVRRRKYVPPAEKEVDVYSLEFPANLISGEDHQTRRIENEISKDFHA